MANSIVRLNGTTLMTVDDTTATAADVTIGTYFYNAIGIKTAGTGKFSNPYHPFPDTDNGTVNYVVSNGNHVHFNVYTGQASVLGLSIGTYQISNGTNVWANTVNNKPKLFTLYTGDEVELSATLTYNSGSRVNTWYFGLREANAASDVLVSESGNTAGKRTVRKVMTEDVDVSTVYLYIGANGMGTNVEVDFEMSVIKKGVTALAPVLENSWDFTTGLTDTVGGLAATLANGATQSSSGVTVAAANQCLVIPLSVAAGHAYEIDFGTMTQDFSSANGRIFMSSGSGNSEGLVYRSTGAWQGYYGSAWDGITPSSDATALSGKTLRAVAVSCSGYNGTSVLSAIAWHFYVDGDEWYFPFVNTGASSIGDHIDIGSGSAAFYTMVITGFRHYSGVME